MGSINKASHSLYRSLKPLLTPQLKHSQYVYKEKLESYTKPGVRWLDAGCGHGVFPDWMKERGASLVARSAVTVGIDCDCPSLWENRVVHHRVAGNLEDLPFPDDSFDLVTANMVVEHISNPERTGLSVNRVLKPGGLFIFHTPNYWNYQTILASLIPQGLKYKLIRFLENREEKDAFPTHYRVNSVRAIRRVAKRTGFAVRELDLVSCTPETFALGPVVILELLLIWIAEFRLFRQWRSNLVVVFEKVASPRKAEAG